MIRRSGSGDRIVLFTLVDLLLQIIFLGLFLFAAYRAVEGDMHDRLAQLARKFGIVQVTHYLNATSKMVSIADLGRLDVTPATKGQTQAFKDATGVVQELDPNSVTQLARLDRDEMKAFAGVYGGLSRAERKRLTALLQKRELQRFLSELAKLSPDDSGAFLALGESYVRADRDTQTKIIAAAASVKPLCFGRHNGYEIVEVPGGYEVHPLLEDVLPDVGRVLPGHRGMQPFVLGEAQFVRLGEVTADAHRTCTVNVKQWSKTNDESQYKTIQRYFGTWWLERG